MSEKAPLIKQDKAYEAEVLKKFDEFNNNGKKTLVYFGDTFFPCMDGVIVVMDNYATKLSKYYNVVLVCPKHKGLVSNQSDYVVLGVKSHYFKFVNYDLAFPGNDHFLKKALKKLRIDIVHAHSPFTLGKFGAKLAKKRSVPFVMTMHSQYKQDFQQYVKSKCIVNMLTNNILKPFKMTDEVWTMHNGTADVLKSYGYKGKFFLIPNAISQTPPSNRKELVEKFNETYKVDNNMPVFMFLGRIVAQKNVFFIVDALKVLDEKSQDFLMFFIGNGPQLNDLKKYVENKGLSKKVFLLGRIDDRALQSMYYQRANLFLFPSLYDSSSIVQIEAALHQTPSVFIKGSVTSRTATDRVNAYMSENSVEEYANTILSAISNKEELEKISQNAFEQIYKNYDMIATMAHDRYEQLMAEKQKTQK